MSAPATAATLPSEPYRGTEPPRLTAHPGCDTPHTCTMSGICHRRTGCTAAHRWDDLEPHTA